MAKVSPAKPPPAISTSALLRIMSAILPPGSGLDPARNPVWQCFPDAVQREAMHR
jgi:hypothetical protein